MRVVAAALLLVACNKLPAPPDRAAFDRMSREDKIDATVPVGARCATDWIKLDLASLADTPGDAEFKQRLGSELDKGASPSGEEAQLIYVTHCLGDPDDRTPRAVYACWDKADDCEVFMTCVRAKLSASR